MLHFKLVIKHSKMEAVTQGSRNRSGQSGHGLTSFGSSFFLKSSYSELKSASYTLSQSLFLHRRRKGGARGINPPHFKIPP